MKKNTLQLYSKIMMLFITIHFFSLIMMITGFCLLTNQIQNSAWIYLYTSCILTTLSYLVSAIFSLIVYFKCNTLLKQSEICRFQVRWGIIPICCIVTIYSLYKISFGKINHD
ncbi:MAG: hypothetical protein LBD05_00060 [Mycoplasmataceae bacterium]|nr:hypothetical protein [Mycoplasmataceae bacterium]